MYFFLAFVLSLFLTLVLTPELARAARRLGLVDIPNARKVHAHPIPRCGGIGIAFATLIPVLMWTPLDQQTLACLIAAGLVLGIGVCDDIRSIDPRWRLLGQIVAAIIVMQAGVLLRHIPFIPLDPAPEYISYPITALFLVGLINAVNLFDGLDGLAGGCVVLTLSAIALLGLQSGADELALTAFAIIGALFGFLRYNTHPAKVFMGDAGSNWLGFTIGVLCVLLLDRPGTALNPALTALLIGLPTLDLLVVVVQRVARKQSPFVADRKHFHHKMLDLGFRHYETVAAIYVVQSVMVASALVLRYCSEGVLVGVYASLATLALTPVLSLHRVGWHRSTEADGRVDLPALAYRWRARLPSLAIALLTSGLTLYFTLGSLAPVEVSKDLAVLALGAAALLVGDLAFVRDRSSTGARVGVFIAAATAAHFMISWCEYSATVGFAIYALLAIMAVILAASVVTCRREPFRVTPQDLLILFVAVVIPNLSGPLFAGSSLTQLAAILVVVFYASEFLLNCRNRVPTTIRLASIASLGIIGVRGFLA